MEDKKEKRKLVDRIFGRIFLILLVFFTALYVSEATGYYEYELHKKVELTDDKIKEFEQDVKNGKNIDIKNYLVETEIDYSNGFSKTGLVVSESIGNMVKTGLESTFNFLNKFMEE